MDQESNNIMPSSGNSEQKQTENLSTPPQATTTPIDVVNPPADQASPNQISPNQPDITDADEDAIIVQPTVAPPPDLAPVMAPIEDEESDDEDIDYEDAETTSKQRKEGLKSTLVTIGILIAAPLIALTLTAFVFQSYEVDGDSMETTLQNNDRLIVWKLPVTLAKLTSSNYIPERGEIIIFHKQEVAGDVSAGDKQLIKRVVGLPGERVVVRDGSVRIYNNDNPDGFDPDATGLYTITSETTPGSVDITVSEGEVFVIGDNRTNSLDSRALGNIRSDEIIGELSMRIFPFNKTKRY